MHREKKSGKQYTHKNHGEQKQRIKKTERKKYMTNNELCRVKREQKYIRLDRAGQSKPVLLRR